jgi:hypothetical protein
LAEKFTRWDASDHLKTEEDITAYFEACLDDDPGDGIFFVPRWGISPKLAICRGKDVGIDGVGLADYAECGVNNSRHVLWSI